MRARYPDVEGTIKRDGVTIQYEVYGSGDPAILLLPSWSLVHARQWKMQIPYLSRHFRVVTFDGRGNGRSDRPADSAKYGVAEFASDALAVMDATGAGAAVLVSVSRGSLWALQLCAEHPDRVLGSVFVSAATAFAPLPGAQQVMAADLRTERPVGWQKYDPEYWKLDYPDFVEFFMGQIFTEPHSTKPFEDAVGWALDTTGYTLAVTRDNERRHDRLATNEFVTKVSCPVLVIHGTDDAVIPHAEGKALAERSGGTLVTMQGAGHFPHVRDAVQVNLCIKQFVDRIAL
jgi:pimeloyl-ACP methyl ester carboxylesterase